jgi:hypothetical protein
MIDQRFLERIEAKLFTISQYLADLDINISKSLALLHELKGELAQSKPKS